MRNVWPSCASGRRSSSSTHRPSCPSRTHMCCSTGSTPTLCHRRPDEPHRGGPDPPRPDDAPAAPASKPSRARRDRRSRRAARPRVVLLPLARLTRVRAQADAGELRHVPGREALHTTPPASSVERDGSAPRWGHRTEVAAACSRAVQSWVGSPGRPPVARRASSPARLTRLERSRGEASRLPLLPESRHAGVTGRAGRAGARPDGSSFASAARTASGPDHGCGPPGGGPHDQVTRSSRSGSSRAAA